MKTKLATDLFDQWAINGKDIGMEEGHAVSVERMIKIANKEIYKRALNPSVLDIGCGNGWMLRKILSMHPNSKGLGVDGSENMIKNAMQRDPSGNYLCTDLNSWKSLDKYNIIISMEVIYYLQNPMEFIKSLFHNTLNKEGFIIVGMDHYEENTKSLSWPSDLNVHMRTLSIDGWINIFKEVGFSDIRYEQFDSRENWAGTLIINERKY